MPRPKDCTLYEPRQIIEEVAKELNLYEESVEEVYYAITRSILAHLLEANENQRIEVRFFYGVYFTSKYVHAHMHNIPYVKEDILIEPKLKFGCRFTKNFKQDHDQAFRDSLKIWDQWYKKNRYRYKEIIKNGEDN